MVLPRELLGVTNYIISAQNFNGIQSHKRLWCAVGQLDGSNKLWRLSGDSVVHMGIRQARMGWILG